MSAEKVINFLLRNHAPLTAVVPATKIFPGLIPLNTELPAIAYNLISAVRPKNIGMETQIVRARIQVTVQTKNYPAQKQIIQLIREACDAKQGTITGIDVDSVLVDAEGPDLRDDDAAIWMQSVDFMVTFRE